MVKILFSKDTIPHGLKSYLNSTRYVAFDKLKLNEIVNVSDLEIGSVQDIEVVYRNKKYCFACEILGNKIELLHPGEILKPEMSMKRAISNNNISSSNKRKNDLASVIEDKSNETATQSETIVTKSSSANSSQIELADETTNGQNISVNKLYSLASQDVFPKKIIIINENESFYTPILNFFDFNDKFEEIPKEKMAFDCKICKSKKLNSILHAKFAKTTNLGKHLKTHPEYKKNWLEPYQKHDQNISQKGVDKNTLLLIKYFISSNTALKELKNKWLRELLGDKFDFASKNAFRDEILPKVYQLMRNEILRRLKLAQAICLITDLWCSKQNRDFIALCAIITNSSLEREILVLDMMRMVGDSHTAENIKIAIEKMVIFCFII